jgi:REP element-mobilizing transposase RayT
MQRGKALQPDTYYHIYNRGNNRESVFVEERNYRYFLKLYEKYIFPIADTFAYCLMPNHFHFLLRIKSEDELMTQREMSDFSKKSDISLLPTRAFAALFTAYTKAFNKTYQRTGRLFQEHFGRVEVDSDHYFTNLVFYIHWNPQKHGFVKDFREWPWSSYGTLISSQPSHVERGVVHDWFGGVSRLQAFHQGAVDERAVAPLVAEDLVC